MQTSILFTIFLSVKFAFTADEEPANGNLRVGKGETKVKVPLVINISEDLPEQSVVYQSRSFPNHYYYGIKPEYDAEYRIGAIKDGQEVIIEDDERSVGRTFMVDTTERANKGLGIFKYVDVSTVYKTESGDLEHDIREFLKMSQHLPYREIDRHPVEVDVSRQDGTLIVKRLVKDDGEILYFISRDLDNAAVIGRVKYGRYIVDDRTDGLVYRFVVLTENAGDRPITITSYTKDGKRIKSKYVFVDDDQGFKLESEDIADDIGHVE
ncbi:signal peptide containing protein [Theileria equi strain WA]|uniref:Signal peptide containing protein n=1 Tax=Theileria equi strain WA TaxID=1537102 RepID=L1LG64_THEEQ|nr:signal peptide containing protein [Theileria equi strain WA]EKX74148.1 signal peptide containing protein [Theileria equi strain WA]|eukprot:XP_004833600.1 signal peptide containing protein [Theileria equi strain WA]